MSREVQTRLTRFALQDVSPQLRFHYVHQDDPDFVAKVKEKNKTWHEQHRERDLAYKKEHYRKNAGLYKQRARERYYLKTRGVLRQRVFAHYGTSCQCCGESTYEFLSIDHINGKKEAEHPRSYTGNKLYGWLIRNNFPPGFQTLCFNCNLAKGFFGACPHTRS